MIQISFKYDGGNNIVGFQCLGHANSAPYGRDIVCAAVSALTINTINSINVFASDPYACKTDEKLGYILFELEETPTASAKLLLKSLRLGLEDIEKNNEPCICFIPWEGRTVI